MNNEEESEVLMMSSWWFLWMIFMFVFLVPSLGYGWGYRRWGAPYPRYIQNRRAAAAGGGIVTGGTANFNHQSWGWGGDFVWMVVVIGLFWAAASLWWR